MLSTHQSFKVDDKKLLKAGFLVSLLLSIVTLITFVFAMTAVPISGANAPGGGIAYPYLDTLKQFPKDYLWQYAALVLMLLYLVFFAVIQQAVRTEKKLPANVGLLLALLSTAVLTITYYTQVTVVPVSLLSGETQGMSLITQYNPHGLFIAMEELGYLFMVLSFAALFFVFAGKRGQTRGIRLIFAAAVLGSVIDLVLVSLQFGIDRKDRFEVVVISLCWLTLIVNGLLISLTFKKHIKA